MIHVDLLGSFALARTWYEIGINQKCDELYDDHFDVTIPMKF